MPSLTTLSNESLLAEPCDSPRGNAILELLADGSLTLTAVGLLAKHLTPENHEAVLRAARHASAREVERQVAATAPAAGCAIRGAGAAAAGDTTARPGPDDLERRGK